MPIEKRGEESYRVTVEWKGVRHRQLMQGSLEEAREVERAMRRSLAKYGEWPPPEPVLSVDDALRAGGVKAGQRTLREALERAYSRKWPDPETNKSHKDQRRRALATVEFFEDIGKGKLGDVGFEEIDRFKRTLVARGLGVSAVNGYLGSLSILYRMARMHPALTLYRPDIPTDRVTNRRDKALSDDDIQAALEFFTLKGWSDMVDGFLLALDCGLRRGEMLALRTDSFKHLDDPARASMVVPGTKTAKSEAALPLTQRAREAAIRAVEAAGKSKRLFPGMSKHIVERRWSSFRDHLGLSGDRGYSFHIVRHTTAKRLIDKGVDIVRVRDFMRHSTTTTTEMYIKYDGKRLADARDALEVA